MQYEIKGGAFPVVICQLQRRRTNDHRERLHGLDESQHGDEDLTAADVGKMFSKAFSGESMFQNIYTARGGNALIAFGSSFPGQILALEIAARQ